MAETKVLLSQPAPYPFRPQCRCPLLWEARCHPLPAPSCTSPFLCYPHASLDHSRLSLWTGPRTILVIAGSPAPPNIGCPQVDTQGGCEPAHGVTELGCPQVFPRPPGVTGQLSLGLADTGGAGHPVQPLSGHCQHRPHHDRLGGFLGLQICWVSTATSPLPALGLGLFLRRAFPSPPTQDDWRGPHGPALWEDWLLPGVGLVLHIHLCVHGELGLRGGEAEGRVGVPWEAPKQSVRWGF